MDMFWWLIDENNLQKLFVSDIFPSSLLMETSGDENKDGCKCIEKFLPTKEHRQKESNQSVQVYQYLKQLFPVVLCDIILSYDVAERENSDNIILERILNLPFVSANRL